MNSRRTSSLASIWSTTTLQSLSSFQPKWMEDLLGLDDDGDGGEDDPGNYKHAWWWWLAASFMSRNEKAFQTLAGAIVTLLILLVQYMIEKEPTSPRAIVVHGWKSATDLGREVGAVDMLQVYRQDETCAISSLDLHHAFGPLCETRETLLEAMSGGGRQAWDLPYKCLGCDMQWFALGDICDILHRFDHIYLIGDSLSRHVAQALNVLIRGDLIDGGRATWKNETENDKDEIGCRCHNAFDQVGCVFWSAIGTESVLAGEPQSIRCPASKSPGIIEWIPALSYPLKPQVVDVLASKFRDKKPDGRQAFIIDHGNWNSFEIDTTKAWVEQVDEVMRREMPAFFAEDLDPALFPRLYMTASAEGEHKPELFTSVQNSITLQRHIRAIRPYVKTLGYEHLAIFNLTVQATSPDGTHASLENNLMKAQMILNWLNLLDPPSNPAPEERYHNMTTEVEENIKDQYVKQVNDPNVPASQSAAQSTPDQTKPEYGAHELLQHKPSVKANAGLKQTRHAIDRMVAHATKKEATLLANATEGVSEAARAYRQRRGRHPPPKFDEWVKWAEERNVIISEAFFDRLDEGLAPFWGVEPQVLRDFTSSWPNVISIRNGAIKRWKDEPANIANWMDMWANGLQRLPLAALPDLDLAFNGEDEPKMFVPWERKQEALRRGEQSKHLDIQVGQDAIHQDFQYQAPLPESRPGPERWTWWEPYGEDEPLWPLCAQACPEYSPGRTARTILDYSSRPQFDSAKDLLHLKKGFVRDFESSKSVCKNPSVRGLHGVFIGMLSSAEYNTLPNQKAIITQLFPLLSGCKIHDVTSEILVPPAMQWPNDLTDKGDFTFNFDSTKGIPWEQKATKVFWRGSASGGVNNETNWTRFQRHRMLAMLNGTLVASHNPDPDAALFTNHLPWNFPLVDSLTYNISVLTSEGSEKSAPTRLGEWISSFADAGFIHLRCFPPVSWFNGNGGDCQYSGPFYTPVSVVPTAEQYKYKYQPDVDGASYSGRFRALLSSNSLPLKATVFDEWHDSRLIPWRHFVPMDVQNVDFWGLMDYFIGEPGKRDGHDHVARKIALGGAQWAEQVLRTEDMLAWMYRLILELARLQDDDRVRLGYVQDLL